MDKTGRSRRFLIIVLMLLAAAVPVAMSWDKLTGLLELGATSYRSMPTAEACTGADRSLVIKHKADGQQIVETTGATPVGTTDGWNFQPAPRTVLVGAIVTWQSAQGPWSLGYQPMTQPKRQAPLPPAKFDNTAESVLWCSRSA